MVVTPIIYNQLGQALQHPGTLGIDFNLSPKLMNMFRKRVDLPGDNTAAIARFNKAKEIYTSMGTVNPPLPRAVFYSMRERDNLVADYNREHMNIRDHISHQVAIQVAPTLSLLTGGIVPDVDELIDIFSTEQNRLTVIPARSAAESIQLELYDHYIGQPGKIESLRRALLSNKTVNNWFESVEQVREVNSIAKQRFYSVNDVDAALRRGEIYAPGDLHNWGVNVAWVLGLIHHGVNINSISRIDPANQNRAHRDLEDLGPQPSAFALEISIALTAGYTLNHTVPNGPTAFTVQPGLLLEDVNGVPGHGILQTRTNQLVIYQEIMAKIGAGNNIVNWIPPTILRQASTTRLATIVALGPDNDEAIAIMPKTATAELRIIAARTNNPAILKAVAAHSHADAATLTAVANNTAHNASSDTQVVRAAVGRKNAALTPALTAIASRTQNVTELQAIARHQNADAGTITAILNNANGINDAALTPTLTAIARRTVIPTELAAIRTHPNANASTLAAVAANPHAPATTRPRRPVLFRGLGAAGRGDGGHHGGPLPRRGRAPERPLRRTP